MNKESEKREHIVFADEHVDDILSGEKDATVRYGWDELVTPQTYMPLVDTSRERFTDAIITYSTQMTMEMFVDMRLDGHRKYDSVEEMADHMNQYYPRTDFDANTVVQVIRFDVESVKDKPWRDKKWLREKIHSGKTLQNISDEVDTSDSVIRRWMDRFGVEKPIDNKKLLEEKVEEGVAVEEMADMWGVKKHQLYISLCQKEII